MSLAEQILLAIAVIIVFLIIFGWILWKFILKDLFEMAIFIDEYLPKAINYVIQSIWNR